MAKTDKFYSTTIVVAGIIAVSKIIGFVREIVVSYYFGQSTEAAAYVFAYGIFSVFTLLFSAGISSTFIPVYTRLKTSEGEPAAERFASNTLTFYVIAGAALGVLGYFGAGAFTALLWKGTPEGAVIIVGLLRRMMLFLPFFAASGVLTNMLNARENFIPEQLMGFALSFAGIFACAAFGTVESLSLATGFAGVLQIIILLPSLIGKFAYTPHVNVTDPSFVSMFARAVPAFISMAFDELNHMIDRYIGSSISDAGVVAMSNSYRLVMTVLGVLVVPVTTIMFSRLSKYAARSEKELMRQAIKNSLEMLALATLPAIAVCVAAGGEIIRVVYQHGAFKAANTAFTAPIFACYMLGVLGFGMRNFMVRVFYSMQDTRTPMRVGICAVLLNITLNYVFAIPLGLGTMGITLATSVSGTLAAIALLVLIRGRLGGFALGDTVGQFAKLIVCALVSGAVMVFIKSRLGSAELGVGAAVLRLAAIGAAGVAVYAASALILKVRSAMTLISSLLHGRG